MTRQETRQNPTSPVPANLAAARAAKGLTFEQLAQAVGVTLRTVVRWEKGEATPRYADLKRLGDVLGQPPDWFYREEAA